MERLPEANVPVGRHDKPIAAVFSRRVTRVVKVVADAARRSDISHARQVAEVVEQLVRSLFFQHGQQPIALCFAGPAIDDDLDSAE